jgi:hypothetical protein
VTTKTGACAWVGGGSKMTASIGKSARYLIIIKIPFPGSMTSGWEAT